MGGDRRREITTSYLWTLDCHGGGREFESRRPRRSFEAFGEWSFHSSLPTISEGDGPEIWHR